MEIFSKKTMPILFDIFEKEWSEQQKLLIFLILLMIKN